MLAALPTSSTSNQQITLTAVVTVPLPGAGNPTGTVQFMDTTGNTVLGTAPLNNIGGVYTATLNTSQLNQSGAPRLLAANYSGDIDFASSASPAQAESVFGTTIAVTNAAGYTSSNFAPGSAAAIFVSNLVTTTLTANTLPLPTSLSGVTVTVTDSAGTQQLAQLYFVSPGQINFLLPSNLAFGLATVTVTNAGGATASGIILITHTAPGIFSAAQSGQGVAMAQFLDVTPTGGQTYSLTAQFDPNTGNWVAAPLSMNATDTYYLQLYGTGIRGGHASPGNRNHQRSERPGSVCRSSAAIPGSRPGQHPDPRQHEGRGYGAGRDLGEWPGRQHSDRNHQLGTAMAVQANNRGRASALPLFYKDLSTRPLG